MDRQLSELDKSYNSTLDQTQQLTLKILMQNLRSKNIIIPPSREGSNFGLDSHVFLEFCVAAKRLAPKYDVGIGLAFGGAGMAFVFKKYGLDVRLVNAKRKGKGASWNPIDNLPDTLKGKNVLVLDEDVDKGGTLGRTYRELSKLNPRTIDVLLKLDFQSRIYKTEDGLVGVRNAIPTGLFNKITSLREQVKGLKIYEVYDRSVSIRHLQEFIGLLRKG